MLTLDGHAIAEKLKLQKVTLSGDKLRCCCPRKHIKAGGVLEFENNPSFVINTSEGWYNCSSCGLKGRDLNTLAEELGVSLGFIPLIVATYYKQLVIPFDIDFVNYNRDIALKYFEGRGILGIDNYLAGASDDGMDIYLPIWGYNGNAIGYTQKNLSVGGGWKLRPGMSREHLLYGAHERSDEEFTYLVESGPDKLQLSAWGFHSLATLSAVILQSQIEMAVRCSARKTVIVEQNDKPGHAWGAKLKKYLRGRVELYEVFLPSDVKDINEMGREFLTLARIKI